MPHGYVPSIFISSTCYDLSQVRVDLKRAIEALGFEPVISESYTFPVNPNLNTVENCLQVVKNQADIFVLIVGARYGSQTDSGRSATNLEYLEARAKGVPIYVFVSNIVLHQLPIWKKHPQLDYSGVVDTPKLFEFVEEVRSANEHWVFGFDDALQISDTLRKQLAFLMMDALLVRQRVHAAKLPSSLANLSGQSLRLVLERPLAWEHLFFASVLNEELAKNAELKWDVKYAIRTGKVRTWMTDDLATDIREMVAWISQKLADIGALVESASALMNSAIQEAMGPLGVSGDPEHVLYVARRIALFHRRLLEWTIDFHDVEVRPQCERILQLMAAFSKDVLEKLEDIPERVRSEIEKAIAAHKKGEKYVADVMIVLSCPPSDELSREFNKLMEWIRNNASDLHS